MATADRSDAIVVRVERPNRTPVRRRYEPRSDGHWLVVEEEHRGACGWRPVGREVVADVTVER